MVYGRFTLFYFDATKKDDLLSQLASRLETRAKEALVGYRANLSQDYSSRISATCSEGRHPHREGIGGGVLATVGAWIAGESRHLFLLLWQRISCITPVVSTDYWNDCRQSHAYAGALLSEITVKGRYLDERVHLLLIWPALSSGMPICTMLRPLWVR